MKHHLINFSFILITIIMTSCSSSDNVSKKNSLKEIMKEDIAFSDYASRNGFFNAFMKFAADDIVKLGEGHFPIIGKAALERSFEGRPGTKNLTWYPVAGEMAESGDIGFTWGNWKLQKGDSTFYGNYYTFWRKEKDGKWKVTLDGGNSTPAPGN